jgi:uncharacterized membrane protein HdeD (DUF308 family)
MAAVDRGGSTDLVGNGGSHLAASHRGIVMSSDVSSSRPVSMRDVIAHELHHVRTHWWCFLILGIVLVIAGTAAIVAPQVTVLTTFAATTLFAVLLMVGGVATIVSAFWIGKWSAFLIQLLVGILYVACGFMMTENPVVSAEALTVFIAVMFIMLGIFRSVAALTLRFPQWGWALLNGVITLLVGIIIFRAMPSGALWVIGLLVGIELLFNGWTWIMLSLLMHRLHREAA